MIGPIILAASIGIFPQAPEPAERLAAALESLDVYAASAMPEYGAIRGAQSPEEVKQRNFFLASALRMGRPVWLPYWAGAFYDLKTTSDAQNICATPEAAAAGWSCWEGNPTAGGDTNAGRIAVTMGISYGVSMLFTSYDRDHPEEQMKWWQELCFTAAIGTARGAIGYFNNKSIYDEIAEDIGRSR